MNLRRNCGVFDELTKKCLACGQLSEGLHCTREVWSLQQCMYYCAQLVGVPTVLDDFDSIVKIVSDNASQRAYGLIFDVVRIPAHLMWVIERLCYHHHYTLNYNAGQRRWWMQTSLSGNAWIAPNGEMQRYTLDASADTLALAATLAGAKIYCHTMMVPQPESLKENKFV